MFHVQMQLVITPKVYSFCEQFTGLHLLISKHSTLGHLVFSKYIILFS